MSPTTNFVGFMSSCVSSAYYVGYAEDEEPVEVIMKKFEELDRLKNELADKKKKALDQDGSSCSKGGDAQCDVSTSMIVVENDDSRKEVRTLMDT